MEHEGLSDFLPLTGKAKSDYDKIAAQWKKRAKQSMITARDYLESALKTFAKKYKRDYAPLLAKAFGQAPTRAGGLLGIAGVFA